MIKKLARIRRLVAMGVLTAFMFVGIARSNAQELGTILDPAAIADASLKGESGFLVYPTQISSGQGVGSVHSTVWQGAEKQFIGGFMDPDIEEAYLNEADIDASEGWSYYPEIVQVVNQNQDAQNPGGASSA
jgi:hypothetical protein